VKDIAEETEKRDWEENLPGDFLRLADEAPRNRNGSVRRSRTFRPAAVI